VHITLRPMPISQTFGTSMVNRKSPWRLVTGDRCGVKSSEVARTDSIWGWCGHGRFLRAPHRDPRLRRRSRWLRVSARPIWTPLRSRQTTRLQRRTTRRVPFRERDDFGRCDTRSGELPSAWVPGAQCSVGEGGAQRAMRGERWCSVQPKWSEWFEALGQI
jgi:hypothetical protein